MRRLVQRPCPALGREGGPARRVKRRAEIYPAPRRERRVEITPSPSTRPPRCGLEKPARSSNGVARRLREKASTGPRAHPASPPAEKRPRLGALPDNGHMVRCLPAQITRSMRWGAESPVRSAAMRWRAPPQRDPMPHGLEETHPPREKAIRPSSD